MCCRVELWNVECENNNACVVCGREIKVVCANSSGDWQTFCFAAAILIILVARP